MGFDADISPTIGTSVPFPCVWNAIKSQDNGIRTAAFTDWDWWWYVTSMGLPGSLDYDFYCIGGYEECDDQEIGNATSYLRQVFASAASSYTFVYILSVDETGHRFSWCGDRYMSAVDVADQQVGLLLDVIDEAGLTDEVSVIISSDHGGRLFGHGRWEDSDLFIPVFIKGPSIRKNQEFQSEVRNVDLSPTAMELLGLKQNPWWKGNVIWEAFEPEARPNDI